jgi:hypothetical protein
VVGAYHEEAVIINELAVEFAAVKLAVVAAAFPVIERGSIFEIKVA